jgi:hypothetical protein
MKDYTSLSRQSDSSLALNSHRSPRRTLSYPQKAERAYRAGVRSVRAKRKASGATELYSQGSQELRAALAHIPAPAHGDRWGDWVFDAKRLTLTYKPFSYEIDLERLTTSARALDVIFQLSGKTWIKRKDIGDLVKALDDLLHPQATLCSWGQAKTLDATKHLEELTSSKYLRPLSTESAVAGFRLVN